MIEGVYLLLDVRANFAVRRSCLEFRVYAAAFVGEVPPEGGTPNHPKRRRRFALTAHCKFL